MLKVEQEVADLINKHLAALGNREIPVLLFLFRQNLVLFPAADSVVRGPLNGVALFLEWREQHDQGRA